MPHDVFISYSPRDKPIADAVCATLENNGIRCWIAPRDILAGMDRGEALIDAINSSRVFILIFSSSANESRDIKREVERAVSKGIIVVPFRIEDVPLSKSLEYFISVPHWLDALTPPIEKHLITLAEKIHLLLDHEAGTEYSGTDSRSSSVSLRKKESLGMGKFLAWISGISIAAIIFFGSLFYLIYRIVNPGLNFVTFSSIVPTTDEYGIVKGRRTTESKGFSENLGDGVKLDMVLIPGDNFWMGSPQQDAERIIREYQRIGKTPEYAKQLFANETPQGPVKVVSFYMSRSEVTQSQWAKVSEFNKIQMDLNRSPSFFRGEIRPVEQVTWEEANEFCDRLKKKTKRSYRLPTEAEWEYAARAGTTTPFHFGDTVTPELVNYDGRYPWGQANAGTYRQQTIDVGSTGVANAFGLFDMHGNVFEWCMDPWHPTYQNSPSGAQVWEANGDRRYRIIRGGSYMTPAVYCRSSSRAADNPAGRFPNVGFRVALFEEEAK
jgi:formylglycine-generating enzyme required for sulfatase activity